MSVNSNTWRPYGPVPPITYPTANPATPNVWPSQPNTWSYPVTVTVKDPSERLRFALELIADCGDLDEAKKIAKKALGK